MKFKIPKGNPLHYLRLYFNFCYFTLIIPYRFHYNEEISKYELKTHKIQKISCMLVLTLCLMDETLNAIDVLKNIHYPEGEQDDPLAYFALFNLASNFFYYFAIINTIWFKSEQFLNLVQYLHENYELHASKEPGLNENGNCCFEINQNQSRSSTSNWKAKLWVTASIAPFILYPLLFIISCFTHPPKRGLVEAFSSTVAPLFFLTNHIKPLPTDAPVKITLTVIRWFILISYTQISTSVEILLPNCGMLLYDAVVDFQAVMRKDGNSLAKILEEYEKLRGLSTRLNKAVGLLTLGMTVGCLPYYVVILLEFIKPRDFGMFLRHFIFICDTFGFLFLAALVNKKAHELEEWLISQKSISTQVPVSRLSILLHDLSGRNIGFNGAGFFKITPAFLGTIISLLLTFSIIIIQFKSASSSNQQHGAAAAVTLIS